MKYLLYAKLTAIVGLTSLTSFTFAQKIDTVKVHRLKEVSVLGDSLIREIIPVQTLSGKALKNLSAFSVADAIRYFSGVQIKDYGGIGGLKTVNVRSLGSQHVGVFYDGVQLGNAQNGVVDLGRFSMDNMIAISLYNGQKSAIFQSAKDFASASSIYLVSRTPEFSGSKRSRVMVGMKAGSFDVVNPSILWEQKLNDKLSSSFNAEYMNTSGKYKFRTAKIGGYDTTEVRQNGDVYTLRLEGGLFGKVKDGEWKAKVYFYNSERGYPGAAVKGVPGEFTHQDRQWDSNFFMQSSFKKKYSDLYSLQLKAKYAYDYLHYLSDPRLDASTMYVNNHFKQQEAYLSAANLFVILPFWTVNASADFSWNTLDADLFGFVYPVRYSAFGALATSLDFDRLKIQGALLGTFVHETTRIPSAAAGNKQKITPSLVASYQPFGTSDFNLRAFYKSSFRLPTFNDLYYTYIGNIYLKPEFSEQYNLGASYLHEFNRLKLKRLGLQVDAYFNQVDNKIIAAPGRGQYRWSMINRGYVEIRGIDVKLQSDWQVSSEVMVNARAVYTYQKAQDLTDRTSPYYGAQLDYIPWNSASLILNPSYKSWNLNYSFIYTGGRYEAAAQIPENYADRWYTHDLGISKTFLYRKREVRLAAEVNNLLNQQYEVVQNYPMPGTNFKFTMNVIL
jgi:vitamin B12 transporter